jgi:hypothetical protein
MAASGHNHCNKENHQVSTTGSVALCNLISLFVCLSLLIIGVCLPNRRRDVRLEIFSG